MSSVANSYTGKTASIARLNGLQATFHYLPITTTAMLRAADLWADARRTGFSTGDPNKLDIDVILSAQALTLRILPRRSWWRRAMLRTYRASFPRTFGRTSCPNPAYSRAIGQAQGPPLRNDVHEQVGLSASIVSHFAVSEGVE